MVSYFHKPLMLSLEVPENWVRATTPDAILILSGPEVDNFRTYVDFNINKINPASPDSFDDSIQATYFSGNMELLYGQFRLVESGKFSLDGYPAFQARMQYVDGKGDANFDSSAQSSHWNVRKLMLVEEGGTIMAVTRLDVVVQIDRDTVYEINGYTLQQHETANIPILEHMLGSIRFIPAKPTAAEEPYHFDINPN
jgi:hypothetical protein